MPAFSPVDPDALQRLLAQTLLRGRDGRRTQDHAEVAAIAAAEQLAKALQRAGLVILQKPPAPAHAGTPPPHSLLKK